MIDDVWAIVGSANLNRRSWTYDSEVACAVLDQRRDPRPPADPGRLARPRGRVRTHRVNLAGTLEGRWLSALYRLAIDPDGRPLPLQRDDTL